MKMKMRQSIKDDEFETPTPLYEKLCAMYDFEPTLDVCCTLDNQKCAFGIYEGSLHKEWELQGWGHTRGWCNPPHTKTAEFVAKAELEFVNNYFQTMMIVPANFGGTSTFHKYVEGKREYHFIEGRPVFLKNGRKTKYPSRNSYIVILWK